MNSIIINPKSQKEMQFLTELLNKLGVSSTILSDEQKEDIGLSLLLSEVDRSDFISEEEVMSKLKN
jgi:hypothetical protein